MYIYSQHFNNLFIFNQFRRDVLISFGSQGTGKLFGNRNQLLMTIECKNYISSHLFYRTKRVVTSSEGNLAKTEIWLQIKTAE